MPLEFFGDIVLYEGRHPFAKMISHYTGSPITHCAFRVSENEAESVDLIAWLIGGDYLKHNLQKPRWYYDRYLILEPIGITSKQRKTIKDYHENAVRKYDWKRILTMRGRHIKNLPQDMEDLSTNNGTSAALFRTFIIGLSRGEFQNRIGAHTSHTGRAPSIFGYRTIQIKKRMEKE